MNPAEKDRLIKRILDCNIPGRRFPLSSVIPVDDRVGMERAKQVVLELERKGLVSKCKATFEDLLFTVNEELETFSERGGFELEDVVFEAEIQKVFLEIEKLRGEMQPGLYQKIMKILEPLAPFAGIAADVLCR